MGFRIGGKDIKRRKKDSVRRDIITLMGTVGIDIAKTDKLVLTVKQLLDQSFATGLN